MTTAPALAASLWEHIPGWFDFDDLYAWAVSDASRDRRSVFVELGTWAGKSLTFMASEIVRSGKPIELVSVDMTELFAISANSDPAMAETARRWNGERLERVLQQNLGPCLDRGLRWRHIVRDSGAAADDFVDRSVDFCFVDANHSYECVRRDIASWWPKIADGGRLAGHDHTPAFPGVVQAVGEFFGTTAKISRSSWYVDK